MKGKEDRPEQQQNYITLADRKNKSKSAPFQWELQAGAPPPWNRIWRTPPIPHLPLTPLSPQAEAPEYGLWSEGEFSLAPRRYLSSLAESIDSAWLSEVADQTQAPTA